MYINYHVMSVCVWLCVAQHLTEALIATTNVDYVCSEKLHLYATPTFKNTPYVCPVYLLWTHFLLRIVWS